MRLCHPLKCLSSLNNRRQLPFTYNGNGFLPNFLREEQGCRERRCSQSKQVIWSFQLTHHTGPSGVLATCLRHYFVHVRPPAKHIRGISSSLVLKGRPKVVVCIDSFQEFALCLLESAAVQFCFQPSPQIVIIVFRVPFCKSAVAMGGACFGASAGHRCGLAVFIWYCSNLDLLLFF